MSLKKSVTVFCGLIALSLICTGCVIKKNPKSEEIIQEKTIVKQKQNISKPQERKYDLYSSTPYDLPLISIAEISKLPISLKKTIDAILERSQGFYYLKVLEDKIFIILQNPISDLNTYQRHNLQFAEIDMDGVVTLHIAGYSGADGELENVFQQQDNEWEFDNSTDTIRPLKHIAYDEKGKIKFVESWNYKEEEPVKYQMLDSHKKVVSILKESQDNDSNLRREQVFYDNDGRTRMSLTVNYDGANISRVTYYNSHDLIDSATIISEYTDGLKVKELIYDEDYNLINKVEAEYLEGERKLIRLFDSEGKEVLKINS